MTPSPVDVDDVDPAAGGRARPTASVTVNLATCEGCTWTNDGPNALALAARHHDAHGHVVVVEVNRITTYGDRTQPTTQTAFEL